MTDTAPLDPRELAALEEERARFLGSRWWVTVVQGPDLGKSLELNRRIRVGTDAQAELAVHDPTVSRLHLELRRVPDGVLVRDLGSRNGTFVGGARISEAVVPPGTEVHAGKSVLKIETADTPARNVGEPASFGKAVAVSAPMRRLFIQLRQVAQNDATVILRGETGVGKELLAEGIHQASPRSGGPFVTFDCGAVAPSLIESELFGHRRGAFTGADSNREGLFATADRGTLFLDELGELPIDLQPKLLRVLETGQVRRVGDETVRSVDVRIVGATHRDLEAEVKAGRFRADLFFRLAVVQTWIPPLRERKEDIAVLVRQFLAQMSRPSFGLTPALLQKMERHHWPGNIRELRNFIECVLAGGEARMLSPRPERRDTPEESVARDELHELPFKEAKELLLADFTREYLNALLIKSKGNLSEAARIAGIARSHFHLLAVRYGLRTEADSAAD